MKRLALTVVVVSLGLTLAGCAGGGGKQTSMKTGSKSQLKASREYASAPHAVHIVSVPHDRVDLLPGHGAAFLSPTRLAFLTSGSSNCRGVPATLAVTTPDSIRVQLKEEEPANGACLSDLVIAPVVIAISPEQIDVHHQLTVRLHYPRTNHPIVFTAPPLS